MSQTPGPTDPGAAPASGAHQNPQLSPEVIATLPMWVKAMIVLVPLVTGSLSGLLTGGQAAAQERAVLAAKVERLERDHREARAEMSKKLDRLTDLILKRSAP